MGAFTNDRDGCASQFRGPHRSRSQSNETPSSRRLTLLPHELLLKTGPLDHASWNYQGLLGYLQRQRYHLARRLLPSRRVDRILEIGYGSGVFMPELRQHCHTLNGIDVHSHKDEVTRQLQQAGVSATLHTASAEALPFENHSLDVVVAVSTLEFVHDIACAAKEIARVVRATGSAVIVTPGDHPLLDFALWLTTGQSAKRDFGDRRARLIPALLREMRLDKRISFPFSFPGFPTLYFALRLVKPSSQAL